MHLRPWAAGQTSCVTCYRIAWHLPSNDRCGQAAAVVECRPKSRYISLKSQMSSRRSLEVVRHLLRLPPIPFHRTPKPGKLNFNVTISTSKDDPDMCYETSLHVEKEFDYNGRIIVMIVAVFRDLLLWRNFTP